MEMSVREKLDEIRMDQRYSYRQLAEATGLSDYGIKKFVYGEGITAESLIAVLDVLGYELYLKEI